MTILFSPSYIGNPTDPARMIRQVNYLEYYKKLKAEIGYDKIILLDSGSNVEDLVKLGATVVDEWGRVIHADSTSDVTIYRFHTELPRTGVWEYPYWWRCLDYLKVLIQREDITKLIHIDTDCYVLTPRLADYVRTRNTGWYVFWSQKYNFPEAAFWIVGEDSIQRFLDFPIPSFSFYNGREAEHILPFTEVVKSFTGDRYGEVAASQDNTMDYYCQWSAACPKMIFNSAKK